MPVLQIIERTAGSVTILTLAGSLTYDEGTRMLRQAVTSAVADGARAFLLNLEEITFYFRYLAALPTLRLTLGNRSVEFMTTQLLAEIRKEPLCRAAGL